MLTGSEELSVNAAGNWLDIGLIVVKLSKDKTLYTVGDKALCNKL